MIIIIWEILNWLLKSNLMQKLTIIRRLGKIKIVVRQLINYFEMEETNEYEKYINKSYRFLSQPLMERKEEVYYYYYLSLVSMILNIFFS